jgi:hypothetical protein
LMNRSGRLELRLIIQDVGSSILEIIARKECVHPGLVIPLAY